MNGDIFAGLYDLYAGPLAVPVAAAFNAIVAERNWAALWKIEFITVIPKIPSPQEAGECRNIACTNFLSKVLESIVLEWARQEVRPKGN